jgi:hypothetical protein
MKDLYHVLLMNLSEECLEVSTCFHKFARFGVESIYLQNNPVDVEIGQVLGIIDMMIERGMLDEDLILKGRNEKIQKLNKQLAFNGKPTPVEYIGVFKDNLLLDVQKTEHFNSIFEMVENAELHGRYDSYYLYAYCPITGFITALKEVKGLQYQPMKLKYHEVETLQELKDHFCINGEL